MKKTELYRTAIDIIKTHHSVCSETMQPLAIGTLEYDPADAWLAVDIIAYRESLLGFADMLLTEDERYNELETTKRRDIEDALADYGADRESIRFALLY